jgi:hypothetical protein
MKKYIIMFVGLLAACIFIAVAWLRVIYIPRTLSNRPVNAPVHVPFTPSKSKISAPSKKPGKPRASPENIIRAKGINLLKNSSFADKHSHWHYWRGGKTHTNAVLSRADEKKSFLRIENPYKKLLGVQQPVPVVSGQVYRLCGRARSMNPENGNVIFGGRIGFWLPPGMDREIVWMTEYNTWLYKELVFTNHVTGKATIYVHMGYGGVGSTGEFTDVKLELLVPDDISIEKSAAGRKSADSKDTVARGMVSNIVYRVSQTGTTSEYIQVLQALREVNNNDTVIIMPGMYREKNAGPEWIMSMKNNIRIRGIGNPVIIVPARDKFYQIGMQLTNNRNLTVEGLTLFKPVYVNNNHIVYGAVFTGCRNTVISNCIFKAELYGTNTTFKNFVAINGAEDITVIDSSIITRDMTGMNKACHSATHGSKDSILFTNVTFNATTLETFCVGPAHFRNCRAEREYTINGFTIPVED